MKFLFYLLFSFSILNAKFEYGESYNCYTIDTNRMGFSFTFHSNGNMVTYIPRNQRILYNELYWRKNRYVNTMETKIELFIKDTDKQFVILSTNDEKGIVHKCSSKN